MKFNAAVQLPSGIGISVHSHAPGATDAGEKLAVPTPQISYDSVMLLSPGGPRQNDYAELQARSHDTNFLKLEFTISQVSLYYFSRRNSCMALLKILRSAQITLPVELRRQFNLAEGDYLEAQAVAGGILLKPVSVVERDKAWTEVMEVMKEVHAKHPSTKRSQREEEEWIAKQVKAFRKTKQSKPHD